MAHIKTILIVLLSIFCGMSFAQLLDTLPKRKKMDFYERKYDKTPNLKYYDSLLAKEKKQAPVRFSARVLLRNG